MPSKKGQKLVWDATCPDTFAPSHMTLAAEDAGFAASEAKKATTAKLCPSQLQSPLRPGGHRDLRSIRA